MKNARNPGILRQHPSQLVVVTTDLLEPEGLIKDRAAEARDTAPQLFAGEGPCVFFKFQYTAPCETFRELRRLILEVQSHTGLRADFRGIVALDATQWLGHEREEYFTVMLKYLYDHRDRYQPVLVLRDCPQAQLQRFLIACAVYMTPRVVDEALFTNRERLDALIRQTFSARGCTLRREAQQLLAGILASPACARARSLTLVERVADELTASACGRREIPESLVRSYLTEGCSALSVLSGRSREAEAPDLHRVTA